ncbi:hypothetical protein ACRAWD_12805 [Caulobacter segnis]
MSTTIVEKGYLTLDPLKYSDLVTASSSSADRPGPGGGIRFLRPGRSIPARA